MNDKNQTLLSDLANLPAEANRRGEENEVQVSRAMSRHTASVLPAVLNRREHLVVREHLAAELALGFEHRREALSMALEMRLQSVREACNHALVTGKTHLRQQRIEYFGQVYRELEQRLQQLADNYIAEADGRFLRLSKIQSEHLRERERARQEKSALDFLDTLDRLLDEFRSILQENVDRCPKPGSR